MKRFIAILVATLSMLTLSAQGIDGYWKGTLNAMGNRIDMAFGIETRNGKLEAEMDIPAQGARGLKASLCTFDGSQLLIVFERLGLKYEGTLLGAMVSGTFSQNGIKSELILVRGKREKKIRPQDPVAPFPYESKEVKFVNVRDTVTLAGTLTVPQGAKTAVVLVSGSGQQNRDEELLDHRPFAVIADFLSRNGIAVLRYDDRGKGGSGALKKTETTADFAEDAASAVRYLRTLKKFSKIGLVGHSEGGEIGYMLASRGTIDFLVSLAGPALRGMELLAAQRAAILGASGMTQEQIETSESVFRPLYEIIGRNDDMDKARQEADKALSTLPPIQKKQLMDQMFNPWMYFFLRYDPTSDIESAKCPITVFNGEKDLQVPYELNLSALKNIAEKNPALRIRTRQFPDLNHIGQHCTTGLPNEYYDIEETVAPELLSSILEAVKAEEK